MHGPSGLLFRICAAVLPDTAVPLRNSLSHEPGRAYLVWFLCLANWVKLETVVSAVAKSHEQMAATIIEQSATIDKQAALIEEYTEKVLDMEEELDDLRERHDNDQAERREVVSSMRGEMDILKGQVEILLVSEPPAASWRSDANQILLQAQMAQPSRDHIPEHIRARLPKR